MGKVKTHSKVTKKESDVLAICRQRWLQNSAIMTERFPPTSHEVMKWEIFFEGRGKRLPPFVERMLEEAYESGRESVRYEICKALGARRE